MSIPNELLAILACPESHQPVTLADAALLSSVNARIEAGELKTQHGETVKAVVEAGLVREDGRCLYPIEDGIPNLLVEERIEL